MSTNTDDMPDWATPPPAAPGAVANDPEYTPSWGAPSAEDRVDGFANADLDPSFGRGANHVFTLDPADLAAASDAATAAERIGLLVLDLNENGGVTVDVDAARLVAHAQKDDDATDCIGVRFDFEGLLVVLWEKIPGPAVVEKLVQRIGAGITPAVAKNTDVYRAYEWEANDLVKADTHTLSLPVLVAAVEREGASDLHVSAGERPWMRAGAAFGPIHGHPRVTVEEMDKLVREVVADFDPETFSGDLDTAVTVGNSRFRVNLYRERGQLGMALRTIPTQIPAFESLGLPQTVLKAGALRQGLVIVVGATGSGKSTSLASIIDVINSESNRKILTLEHPIEFVHASKMSMVHQREVGTDTVSFAKGLNSALRQAPNIILIGEMRDYEEISNALTLAETGHIVFATIHAHNTAGAMDRIIDVFPADQQNQVRTMLAAELRMVLCQKLVPDANDPKKRWLAYELAFVNDAIKSIIANPEKPNTAISEAIRAGRKEGMLSFDECLAVLAAQGKVDPNEAARYAVDADLFDGYLTAERRRLA